MSEVIGRLPSNECYERENGETYEMIVTQKWRMVVKKVIDAWWERETEEHELSTGEVIRIGDLLYGEFADNDIQLREDGRFKNKDQFQRWTPS